MHWAAVCSLARRAALASPATAFGLSSSLCRVPALAFAPPLVASRGTDGVDGLPPPHAPRLISRIVAAAATGNLFTAIPPFSGRHRRRQVYRVSGDITATGHVGRMSRPAGKL